VYVTPIHEWKHSLPILLVVLNQPKQLIMHELDTPRRSVLLNIVADLIKFVLFKLNKAAVIATLKHPIESLTDVKVN
jgi:hypothetical protein